MENGVKWVGSQQKEGKGVCHAARQLEQANLVKISDKVAAKQELATTMTIRAFPAESCIFIC